MSVTVINEALRRMVTELTDLTGFATVSLILPGVFNPVTSKGRGRNPKSITLSLSGGWLSITFLKRALESHILILHLLYHVNGRDWD